MICKACAQGADHLAKFRNREVAKQFHDICDGCDCQHRVELQAEGRSVKP